ncbi:MAG: NAD-dependent epimerase/dehydratase family protein, partial [Humidesulfovibrio sp.]|nr:NAD-dependent epimerase/dehydratase family protein [Humidesulfovibrio sp.]
MYIITGGAGFIGSAMIWKLNQMGIDDILVVANRASTATGQKLVPLPFSAALQKDQFLQFPAEGAAPIGTTA